MQTPAFLYPDYIYYGLYLQDSSSSLFSGETLLTRLQGACKEIHQLWRAKRAARKRAGVSRWYSVTSRYFPKRRACSQATALLPVQWLILTGERSVVCHRIWKNNLCFSDVTGSTIGIQLISLYIYIQPSRLSKQNLSELKWTILSNSLISLSLNSRLWIIFFWLIFEFFIDLSFWGSCVNYREILSVTLNKKSFIIIITFKRPRQNRLN